MDADVALPMAAWISLHAAGLMAAWFSRLEFGRVAGWAAGLMLVGLFAAIAVVAAVHMTCDFHLTVLSGTTLGAMVVTAVCEWRSESVDSQLNRFLIAQQ